MEKKKSFLRKFSKKQAFIVAAVLVMGFSFHFFSAVQSATYTFLQSSWSGGVSSSVATHASDRTGWNEYSSASGVSAGTSVQLSSPGSYSFTDDGTTSTTSTASTAGGGFSNGTNSNTTVNSSGTGASVGLTPTLSTVNQWDTTLSGAPVMIDRDTKMIRNGSDDEIYVFGAYSTASGQAGGFYRYNVSTNSWTTLAGSFNFTYVADMIRNGSDNEIYLLGRNSSFYRYSISGNSWTTLGSPGIFSYGLRMIRDGSSNDIYILAGNVSTAFYKYSISGNSWTTLTAVPETVSYGSQMFRNASDDDIYVLPGGSSTGFYKYSVSGDSWTTLAAIPGIVYTGSQVIRYGSSDDVYATSGSNSNGFYKYSISGNSWTTLTVVPTSLSDGAQMIRNASDNDIYVLPGAGQTGFYKYSISGNSWTTLTVVPSAVYVGGQMIRNGSDDEIYVLSGYDTTGFFRYSISGNSWVGSTTSSITDAPAGLDSTSQMIRSPGSNDVYILKSNGSVSLFYKYSISSNSWTTLTSMSSGFGGKMIHNGSDDEIYVMAGGTVFYRYSISGNSWTTLTALPGAIGAGFQMIRNGSDNDIYVLRGGATTFYKYSISGNSWTTLATVPLAPAADSQMIRNGSDNTIYVLRGTSTGLYAYSVSGNSWTTLTSPAVAVGTGAQMIRNASDNDIYVLIGAGSTTFKKYSISGNSWTTLGVAPVAISGATQMIRNGSDNDIYLLYSGILYKYSISGGTWSTVSYFPVTGATGAKIMRDSTESSIYAMSSNNSATLYRFLITANTYTSPGIFTSAVIDLGTKGDFSSIMNGSSTTLPTTTGITYDFRAGNTASPDGAWSSWTTGISSGGSLSAFSGKRYFQYRVNFTTTSNLRTPTLASVDTSYTQYAASGNLVSSVYDSSSDANVLGRVAWTATGTSSDELVRIQVRSSSDGVSWNAWCGYADCSGSTYFDQADNNVALSGSHPLQTGGDDRYFQYRATLTSGGVATPALTDISLQYVVNAAPEVQNVTASQGSDGLVSISYEARDTDTTTGNATPGLVTPTFQYWNGSAWVAISTLSSGSSNQVVNESTFSSHSAVWNAPTDFSGQYLPSTVKIRVTVNDNEGANNTASADSTSFVFDTKTPTGNSVTVDATTVPATIHLASTDDTALEVMYSLDSGFSGASWESYATTKTIALATDPDTVYVRFKDAYGNMTTSLSATTPETPVNVMVQDTSNLLITLPEYRLFVAWKTVADPTPGFDSYEVYRATESGAFSLFTTIASRPVNYYGDSSVAYDTTLRYKLASVDNDGNRSYFSSIVSGKADGIQGPGEGGGGSGGLDTTDPVISNVGSSVSGTSQATIHWDTDEAAYSTAGFSVSAGIFTQESGVASLANTSAGLGRHEVTLTGLNPNTTYHYQIKSTDISGNTGIDDNGGNGYSFTTDPGPAIVFGSLSGVGDNEATIAWTTSTVSTSSVRYSTAVSAGALVNPVSIGPAASGTSHSQTLSGLTAGTTYYFSLYAADASGNTATDTNSGNFYSFDTTADTDGPVITAIDTPLLTPDSLLITWSTDEAATSQVRYSLTAGGVATDTIATTTYDESHAVVVSGLSAGTRYYFKVVSVDLSGNSTVSSEESAVTALDPSMDHPALSEISDISDPPTFLTDTKAVITFKTDQSALCYIEYGTSSEDYSEMPVSETLYNREHAIHLSGLAASTAYFYRIDCSDNTYHLVVSDELSFTTLPEQVNSGSESGDTTAPTISNVSVSASTGESATITWDTDEDANSFVRYGLTNAFGKMDGDDLVNTETSNYATSHTVTLTGLIPGKTKYFFTVLSSDASGNVGQSSENSFSTKDAASVSSIRSFSQKIGEVTVAWKTSVKTTSSVEYGLTESYSDAKGSSSSATDHEITLSGLKANTTYHFRVKGKDALGNIFVSSDLTFEPKSPPVISDVRIETLSEHEAKVTFTSNVPTDALVVFQGLDGSSENGSQGDPTLTQKHTVILKNLAPGTRYRAIVKAQDEAGNASQNSEKTFETRKDDTAPVIDQIRTEIALTQDNKVQSLLSWTTDEPAFSSILYREGQYGDEQELSVSKDLSQNHIAVLTSFKPGSVYYFKVKVSDAFGNMSVSNDYMALTPKRTENIVEIIIGNFKDIFSWTKQ